MALQNECLREDIDPVLILRKAYVIARKLKLDDFQRWTESELKSYSNSDNIPEYRVIRGILYGKTIYGPVPVQLSSHDLDTICTTTVYESIPSICDMLSSGSKTYCKNMEGDNNAILSKLTGFETHYYVSIEKHQLRSIIDATINKILEWTLTLEENGIIGEEYTFTMDEVEKANAVYHNCYVINGNVESIQTQENSSDCEQITTLINNSEKQDG